MKKLILSATENAFTTDVMLALFRIYVGLSLALAHGMGKVPPSEGFIGHTADLGFPFPTFFAWAAGLSEFLGGILLALGLLTRPAAFFIAFTMFVAGFINHGDDPFGSAEKAYLFMGLGIVYMVIGAGRLSLDHFVRRKLNI